jgi:hypothetical protein
MEYQQMLLREKVKFETDEHTKANLIRQADELSFEIVKKRRLKPKN